MSPTSSERSLVCIRNRGCAVIKQASDLQQSTKELDKTRHRCRDASCSVSSSTINHWTAERRGNSAGFEQCARKVSVDGTVEEKDVILLTNDRRGECLNGKERFANTPHLKVME